LRVRSKILVVDDIKDIRDMLRTLLETKYDVVLARNGEEAWELFNSEQPDLVLSDVVMPRINGMELVKRIKLQSFRPHTPVILMTAATKDKELADGFWNKAAGTDAFISKPFSLTDVLEKVSSCLARAEEQKARNQQKAPDETR
jgi:two-component system, OmpR family, response regulator VicR